MRPPEFANPTGVRNSVRAAGVSYLQGKPSFRTLRALQGKYALAANRSDPNSRRVCDPHACLNGVAGN
jgi:hypothetical protein